MAVHNASSPSLSEGAQGGLRHEALFYRDEDEFLRGTLPVIERAVEAGDPAMVVLSRDKVELIRAELDEPTAKVRFADMTQIGRNPARLISVWRDFLTANLGATRLHGIGQPAWPGRNEDELTECAHHEALLNRAFGGAPRFRLLCPYDASALDGSVLEHALRSHPWIVDATATRASADYRDPGPLADPLAAPLAPPPVDAERLVFAASADLHGVRRFARGCAAAAGLPARRVSDVGFAINELATNSLLHGGGAGALDAWERPGAIAFEVSDRGRIDDAMIGRARPAIDQSKGRGMWLVNELCDLVQVRSGADGTRVRLWLLTGS